MGAEVGTRMLPSGKLSFKVDPPILEVVILATRQRIAFEELPEYLHYLLEEVVEKLEHKTGRISLRKSEFFALFDPAIAAYLDEPTQIVLKQQISFKEIQRRIL